MPDKKVWVPVCPLDQIPTDKAVNVLVNGQRYVITRDASTAYVLQGYCTHMLFPLKDAKVEDCVLECSLHGSRFDIRSGEVLHWPMPLTDDVKQKKSLRSVETRIDNGVIYLAWSAPDESKVRVRI